MSGNTIKVGITGASGFIGQCLSSYLNSKNFTVFRFTNLSGSSEHIKVNLEDTNHLRSKLEDLDVLIHLAWVGSDRGNRNFSEIQQRNVLIAENIVSVLKDTNISRLIGVGSQDELLDGEQPWQDHSKIYPTNAYSNAKNQCFEIFSESITNFTWARLFSVYGRNDKRSWVITEAVKAIKNNTTVSFGNCSKPWSLTHINDVCLAFELLLENNVSGTVNISNIDAPILRNHLELLQDLARTKLFNFAFNNISERSVSRTVGTLDAIGWRPIVKREEGFLELIR
jgi:nucleoside-diphosphate-sugar epimerase